MVPKLPKGFDELRSLRNANVFAVAASMAAMTGAVFGWFGRPGADDVMAGIPTVTTFLVGLAWAATLRVRKRVTRRQWQLGWVLSVPLAALNGALAAGVLFVSDGRGTAIDQLGRFLGGMVAGLTIGAVIWIPALVATLLCFGFPIARAQRLAERGLAGTERGERVVGISAAVLGVIGTLIVSSWETTPVGRGPFAARGLVVACGLFAAAAGASSAMWATARSKRREAFVKDAEAGRVAGYRVDTGAEGKVLVRVDASGNDAYRSGDRFEAVYELAVDGEAKRALV
jgi:hypothetical protein